MGVCNNCGNQISDGQLTCPVTLYTLRRESICSTGKKQTG